MQRKRLAIQLRSWPLWLCVLLCGCSTHADFLQQPRDLFYRNELGEAEKKFTTLQRKKREADVAELDLAMIELVQGRPKEAEKRLKVLRDRFDELEKQTLAAGTLSYFTDDQTRTYVGEDYEKILLRLFLALSNLMHDGGDAEAYSLQMHEKQQQLYQKAVEEISEEKRTQVNQAYRPLPIGYYLRGLLREQTMNNYDDAVRNYEAAVSLNPMCEPLRWDLERAKNGVYCSPGHGVLYVFAMVGRGPHKIEVAEYATSDALLIADRIVSAVGPMSVPPTLAPIKIPKVVVPQQSIDCLGVSIDGTPIGPTANMTDIATLAEQTHQAAIPKIMARAVARRVVKKASVYAAKDQLAATAPLASLAMDAAGVAWEATESADTRCWGLLPREIQVLRVEVPTGRHQLRLTPLLDARALSKGVTEHVEITAGRNTYVLCYFPDTHPIGELLISHR